MQLITVELMRAKEHSECLNATTAMRGIFLFACLAFAAAQAAVAQRREPVPVPEYYGIYALMSGKLFGIGLPKLTMTPEQTEIKIGQPSSGDEVMQGGPPVHVTNRNVLVLSRDVQFLVFAESSSGLPMPSVASELKLEQLAYVRNATIQTAWPKAVQRTAVEEAWDTGATAEYANLARATGMSNRTLTGRVELLVKPGQGQSNITIAVPANQLTPGLYLLTGMDVSFQNHFSLFFAVQPIAEGERTTCIDVTYRPPAGEVTHAPCGAVASTGQPPPMPTQAISKADSVVGHYVNEQNGSEHLDLETNGAFRWRVSGRDFTGSYKVSEDIVTLSFPPVGATAHGRLANGRFNCCLSNGLDPTATALIDDESKNWVKHGEPQSVSAPSPASPK
jgi:hypothetical protein